MKYKDLKESLARQSNCDDAELLFTLGELHLDMKDMTVFYKDASGTVGIVEIGLQLPVPLPDIDELKGRKR